MSQRRKLVAILAADVAGYSRLMADDERATVETLNAYRKLFRDRVTAHEGRVVDSPGDALLAEYRLLLDAHHGVSYIGIGMETSGQRPSALNVIAPERRSPVPGARARAGWFPLRSAVSHVVRENRHAVES